MTIGDDPWFVAADVCRVLELSNPTVAVSRLDDDEALLIKSREYPKLNLGRAPSVRVVSESGLYDLIMQSRKPEAKAFKRWVTKDVLPAIRKDGGYVMGEDKVATSDKVVPASSRRLIWSWGRCREPNLGGYCQCAKQNCALRSIIKIKIDC